MKKYPILTLILILMPSIVFAGEVCDRITTSPSAQKLCEVIEEIGYIIAVAGGALAIVFVIIGGVKYLTAGDDTEKTKSARQMIINALIGLALVLMAYFLVNLVADFIADRFMDDIPIPTE